MRQKRVYERDCPLCGKKIVYKTRAYNAIKNNSLCKSCASKGSRNSFFGKKHTKESLDKMQNKDMSVFKKPEFGQKMSKINGGKNNPMFNKTVFSIWKEKYGEEEATKRNEQRKQKISEANRGENNRMYGKPAPKGSGAGWSGTYKGFFFRSIRELSYVVKTLEANNLKWVSAESKKLSIEYVNSDGQKRTYRADFLVENKTLVEIKPKKLFNLPIVQIKGCAAIEFCRLHGYDYQIIDPDILSKNELDNLINQGFLKFSARTEIFYQKYFGLSH